MVLAHTRVLACLRSRQKGLQSYLLKWYLDPSNPPETPSQREEDQGTSAPEKEKASPVARATAPTVRSVGHRISTGRGSEEAGEPRRWVVQCGRGG